MIKRRYGVEWSYETKVPYCYTEYKNFATKAEQRAFAKEKYDEANVYRVSLVTEEVWEKG